MHGDQQAVSEPVELGAAVSCGPGRQLARNCGGCCSCAAEEQRRRRRPPEWSFCSEDWLMLAFASGRLRKSEGDADELQPAAASSARACSRTDRSKRGSARGCGSFEGTSVPGCEGGQMCRSHASLGDERRVRSAGGTRAIPTVVPCLGTFVPGLDLMAGSMPGETKPDVSSYASDHQQLRSLGSLQQPAPGRLSSVAKSWLFSMRHWSGAGSVLMFEGLAGIGKTSLLAAAAAARRVSSMVVFHARGTPLEHEW